ncbi:hypothetical protein SCHPADRAFT_136906 [Schizopora paradoxa]|uniref:GST N-terminal domain-containing protein n=1 Tax=Schizopora paradoxa TaxID=27342 RepID=A0A0H2S2L5_9AGAM|nr:hypothetical protein SCHPADRAFT_136906 [Schizopora paradoxa]
MITLYDIPSKLPGKAFSNNIFKARLAIAFKGLPFKTEWVEMCDIGPKMKALGADPTQTNPDGSPKYTLPVIYDDATGKCVSESMKIAEYLEATYPDKPSLFPFGTYAPIHLFNEYFPDVVQPGFIVFVSAFTDKLNPPTLEYIRRTREPLMGKKLEEMIPSPEEKVTLLAATKENFSKLDAIYASNGAGKMYFFGNIPSYADLILAANLIWIMLSVGMESNEWNAISNEWDGGRWGTLLKTLEKYNVNQ